MIRPTPGLAACSWPIRRGRALGQAWLGGRLRAVLLGHAGTSLAVLVAMGAAHAPALLAAKARIGLRWPPASPAEIGPCVLDACW